MEYGTGAIMAVPGHDERDFEFAKAFDLAIVSRRRARAAERTADAAARPRSPRTGKRPLVNSGQFSGTRRHRRFAEDRRVAAQRTGARARS